MASSKQIHTDEQIRAFVIANSEAMTREAIRTEMKCGRGRFKAICDELVLEGEIKPAKATQYGFSAKSLRGKHPQHKSSLTVEQMVSLKAKGITIAEIGRRAGVSHTTVSTKLKRYYKKLDPTEVVEETGLYYNSFLTMRLVPAKWVSSARWLCVA